MMVVDLMDQFWSREVDYIVMEPKIQEQGQLVRSAGDGDGQVGIGV